MLTQNDLPGLKFQDPLSLRIGQQVAIRGRKSRNGGGLTGQIYELLPGGRAIVMAEGCKQTLSVCELISFQTDDARTAINLVADGHSIAGEGRMYIGRLAGGGYFISEDAFTEIARHLKQANMAPKVTA